MMPKSITLPSKTECSSPPASWKCPLAHLSKNYSSMCELNYVPLKTQALHCPSRHCPVFFSGTSFFQPSRNLSQLKPLPGGPFCKIFLASISHLLFLPCLGLRWLQQLNTSLTKLSQLKHWLNQVSSLKVRSSIFSAYWNHLGNVCSVPRIT